MRTPLDDERERDRAIKAAAFKIVSLLDGLTLCNAAAAVDLAKRVIMTTHKIDAGKEEIKVFQQESRNVL